MCASRTGVQAIAAPVVVMTANSKVRLVAKMAATADLR